jgi:hypothetical protein
MGREPSHQTDKLYGNVATNRLDCIIERIRPRKGRALKYIVTIRAAPAPEGDVIRVMEMTAESAAHARHFAVKMHGAQSTALPADLWVSSRPMETFDEETFCQTGPE